MEMGIMDTVTKAGRVILLLIEMVHHLYLMKSAGQHGGRTERIGQIQDSPRAHHHQITCLTMAKVAVQMGTDPVREISSEGHLEVGLEPQMWTLTYLAMGQMEPGEETIDLHERGMIDRLGIEMIGREREDETIIDIMNVIDLTTTNAAEAHELEHAAAVQVQPETESEFVNESPWILEIGNEIVRFIAGKDIGLRMNQMISIICMAYLTYRNSSFSKGCEDQPHLMDRKNAWRRRYDYRFVMEGLGGVFDCSLSGFL